MDTKKAIEVLKMYKYQKTCFESQMKENEELDNIIELLEDGGKYKKILEELEDESKAKNNFIVPEEYLAKQGGIMEYLIKKLKEKYSPDKPEIPEKWERFVCVDFPSGASFIVKMTVTKDKNGITMIRYEPKKKYGDTLEKGGET